MVAKRFMVVGWLLCVEKALGALLAQPEVLPYGQEGGARSACRAGLSPFFPSSPAKHTLPQ